MLVTLENWWVRRKAGKGKMLLKAGFFTKATLSSNDTSIIFLFNKSLKDFFFFVSTFEKQDGILQADLKIFLLQETELFHPRTHTHAVFLRLVFGNKHSKYPPKNEKSFLVRLMSWISSSKGQMNLKAAQESFYPHAAGGRHKPGRGVEDWCCVFFLVEMHLSNGENPSEMFFCCTGSSFVSIFPPLTEAASHKDNFDSVSTAKEPPVFQSACVAVHLHPTRLIQRADGVECLCAKSVSCTVTSLISQLGFWLLLNVLTTRYTYWGTCARNASTDSYCKVHVEAQR